MPNVLTSARPWPRSVTTGLLIWVVLALAVALSGVFESAPVPVIGGTITTLATITLLGVYFVAPLRAWAQTVSLRVFVLYHTVRFVGIAFLVFYVKGTIPGAFAITAGWGDLAAAIGAIFVVLLALPVTSRWRWWMMLLWNIFGMFDIVWVIQTGIRLGISDRAQMVWITEIPWSLLPMLIVPLVIVSHVLIFVRLRGLWWEMAVRESV